MRIGSHQHSWKYNPDHQVWMTDEMAVPANDKLTCRVKYAITTQRLCCLLAVRMGYVERMDRRKTIISGCAVMLAAWLSRSCACGKSSG